jgi:hypothetical protein
VTCLERPYHRLGAERRLGHWRRWRARLRRCLSQPGSSRHTSSTRSHSGARGSHGRRSATLRTVTRCVIATAAKDQIDRHSLASLAGLHHGEDRGR